jgi:hypothetical protein
LKIFNIPLNNWKPLKLSQNIKPTFWDTDQYLRRNRLTFTHPIDLPLWFSLQFLSSSHSSANPFH